ncbi:dnaJ homolog subfamily C member 27-like isoform X2 [Hetaerina americana]|uniref:dnaJ homolog subfamily C member 27-like isoform X2 n=1 Tax=Hetaerina americana TaxID=62018 RepID=UPI003A7F5FA2
MDQKRHFKRPFRIKIISVGDNGVGKTCLIKRYYEKRFVPQYYATIGIDYGVTKTVVDKKDISVNIFDLSGDPIFYEVRNEFYKGTHGAILVYDVTSRKSFEALDMWLMEMQQEMASVEFERTVVTVCANKVDKGVRRAIDEAEGRLWADLHAFPYFETSAKTGLGVQVAFETLFTNIVRAQEFARLSSSRPTARPPPSDPSGVGRPTSVDGTPGVGGDHAGTVHRLLNAPDDFEKLGLQRGATVEEINRAYRRLAVLLHPDKTVAPGAEEAFKVLSAVRASLLQRVQQIDPLLSPSPDSPP